MEVILVTIFSAIIICITVFYYDEGFHYRL